MKSHLDHLPLLLTPCLALVLSSCGSSESSNGTSQPGPDAAGQDVAVDVQPDAVEAGADAPSDSGPDALAETSTPDAPQDTANLDGPLPDQDADSPWPTCDVQPSGVPEMTLPQVWASDPSAPSEVWVAGAYITAISWGGCSSGNACQIFLQDAETYASFAEGAHHGMKLFVSAATAGHFDSLHVGDQVDVYAHAWRYDLNPAQNELLLQVNSSLRGCAKAVGAGSPTPIQGVELTDLTVDAYETTHGPLLVKLEGVSGKPGAQNETFALWKTGGPFVEAGIETVVSASPYFLSGGGFNGLPTSGTTVVDFKSITGVFGLFVPPADGGAGAKYLMLYPRDMTDMPTL